MLDPKIEILDHTADLALRLQAPEETSLFTLGADAVYQMIGALVPGKGEAKTYRIALNAGAWEELLHDWLSEILYWLQVREIMFHRYTFEVLTKTHIKATAEGKKIDVEKSAFHCEIKAVTYHHLKVEKKPEGVIATVIFDV
jgi:SHS2 domain-containing protein